MKKLRVIAFTFFCLIALCFGAYGLKMSTKQEGFIAQANGVNQEVCTPIIAKNNNDGILQPGIQYSWAPLIPSGTYTVEFVFYNFTDYANYDEEDEINECINSLSEQIDLISNFITNMSNGKVKLQFNIGFMDYNDTAANVVGKEQKEDINMYTNNASKIYYAEKVAKADIVLGIMEYDQFDRESSTLGYMCIKKWIGRVYIANFPIIAHEILHVFGCPDLYGPSTFAPVSRYEIMNSYSEEATEKQDFFLNAYLRNQLGWLTVGSSNEDYQTIDDEGTYFINYNTTSSKIAYEFGRKDNGSEFFLIEANPKGLYVQRINTRGENNNPLGHLYGSNQEEHLEVFAFRTAKEKIEDRNREYFYKSNFGKGQAVEIYYSDGTFSNYFITNIKNENNGFSFTITSSQPEGVVKEFKLESEWNRNTCEGGVTFVLNGITNYTLIPSILRPRSCELVIKKGDVIEVFSTKISHGYKFTINDLYLDDDFIEIYYLEKEKNEVEATFTPFHVRMKFQSIISNMSANSYIVSDELKNVDYRNDITFDPKYGNMEFCDSENSSQNIYGIMLFSKTKTNHIGIMYKGRYLYSINAELNSGVIEFSYPVYGKEFNKIIANTNAVVELPYYENLYKYTINAKYSAGDKVRDLTIWYCYEHASSAEHYLTSNKGKIKYSLSDLLTQTMFKKVEPNQIKINSNGQYEFYSLEYISSICAYRQKSENAKSDLFLNKFKFAYFYDYRNTNETAKFTFQRNPFEFIGDMIYNLFS